MIYKYNKILYCTFIIYWLHTLYIWTYIYIYKYIYKYSDVMKTIQCSVATGTIIPKWDEQGCSQVTLARLFPSDTGTIFPKWHWHNCSQVRLAQLFPSETDPIVPKWHWHDCLQVRLAQLFPRETSKVVPKWTGTIVPKWILTFCFVFCFAVFSLARFFTSEFHLGRIGPCTRVY